MAPGETENNAYANFWGDKQRTLWYVMVFSGVVNCCTLLYHKKEIEEHSTAKFVFPRVRACNKLVSTLGST